MHNSLRIARLSAVFVILAMVAASCPPLLGQQPPHCAQNLFCLFNQEAAANDAAGVHKYSEDLIGLIVFNPAHKNYLRRLTNELADHLAEAEQATRAGDGELVPEANVAQAFNDLMQEIGAPSSLRTDVAALHSFREHAASIKAFPALLTENRNGTNCNPGEAVFLLSLLISDNGVLYKGNVDTAQELIQLHSQQGGGSSAFRIERGPESWRLLSSFPSDHSRSATIALFDHMADKLGF